MAYFTQMKPLEGLLILPRQNKSHGDIYKKEKGRRQIYDGLGSRVSVNAGSHISLIARPPLNCIQGIKRMLGGSSPQMRAIFETGVNLSHV